MVLTLPPSVMTPLVSLFILIYFLALLEAERAV